MVRIKALLRRIASGDVRTALVAYLVAYVLLQYSGLFSRPPEDIMHLLHKWPAITGIIMLLLSALAELAMSGSVSASPLLNRIFNIGLILASTGILLSSFTRFEGRIVIPEGQAVSVASESDMKTVYQRRYSRPPAGDLFVYSIAPFGDRRSGIFRMFRAAVIYKEGPSSPERRFNIRSIIPHMAGLKLFSIRDAGYSPHVSVFDLSGGTIDSFYAVMQLLPAGAEDYFRLKEIPHTFYVRYYPDKSLVADSAAVAGKKGPIFKVRIVRNLDIVADLYAAAGEEIRFDALMLYLGDVKKWIEVRVVSDPGIYVMAPGLLLMLAGGFPLVFRACRSGRGK